MNEDIFGLNNMGAGSQVNPMVPVMSMVNPLGAPRGLSDDGIQEFDDGEDRIPNEALTGIAPNIHNGAEPEALTHNQPQGVSSFGDKFEMFKKPILDDIHRANNYFEGKIEPILRERRKLYEASEEYYNEKYPKTAKQSKFVSYDFWSLVQWAIPNIMNAFFGGDDTIVIVGRGPEDVHRAEVMKNLIQYQLLTQNKGFLVFWDWFCDAMQYNLGAVKCYWKRSFEWGSETLESVPVDRFMMMQQDPNIRVNYASEPDEFGLVDVSYTVGRMAENRPVLEPIRIPELRWSPEARSLSEANFVAHRKTVTADHLRRQARSGIYDAEAVERVIESGQSNSINRLSFESELNDSDDWDYSRDEDAARHLYELYECYVKLDINQDGLLEDALVTVVNDEIVRIDENPWGRVPIFTVTPVRDPFRVLAPLSFAEIMGEIQDLKVAMTRQVIINTANVNNIRHFVDQTKVDPNDLKENRQYIKTTGNPSQIAQPFPQGSLAPWTMTFFEYLEGLTEQWTGRTRYNQGTDSSSLNKTATGISLLQQASAQRIDYIVRVFAETGVAELMRFLVELNQRYIDQPQVIRLENEFLEVTPDDLKGEFDIDVNTEAGVGKKRQTIQNLQVYLTSIAPTGMQIQAITPSEWAKAAQKLLRESGIRDPENYVLDPEVVKKQFFQQMAQEFMQQQMQQAQQQAEQQAKQAQEAGATPEQAAQIGQQAGAQAAQQLMQNVTAMMAQSLGDNQGAGQLAGQAGQVGQAGMPIGM